MTDLADLCGHRTPWPAARLLFFLIPYVTESADPWWRVAGGNIVRDEELAYKLGYSAASVARWRKILVRAGFIKTERCKRGGFFYWVQNLNTLSGAQLGAEISQRPEAKAESRFVN